MTWSVKGRFQNFVRLVLSHSPFSATHVPPSRPCSRSPLEGCARYAPRRRLRLAWLLRERRVSADRVALCRAPTRRLSPNTFQGQQLEFRIVWVVAEDEWVRPCVRRQLGARQRGKRVSNGSGMMQIVRRAEFVSERGEGAARGESEEVTCGREVPWLAALCECAGKDMPRAQRAGRV